MTRFPVIFLGLCVAGFAGCSSDSTGGSSSGVDKNKQLSQLSDSEATQLCEAHKSGFQALVDNICVLFGVQQADEASCQESLGPCNMLFQGDGGTATVDCTNTDALNWQTCDATVGDVEACESDLTGYFESLDCSQAGSGSVPELPSCAQNLTDQCPDVFGTAPPPSGGGTPDGG